MLWREWHRSRPSRIGRLIRLIYVIGSVTGAGVGIREAIAYGPGTPSGLFIPNTVLLAQFVLGLTIVSCAAPASLAEERVRGSLDVLLTTPLSTRSILWGKWVGIYRIVLWLAVLPGLMTVILAYLAPTVTARFVVAGRPPPDLMQLSLVDRVAAPCLIVGQMLSYGAAITSAGLALATWVSRLGRAIAINIITFVLITIGWPVLFQFVIWYPLREWLATQWYITGPDSRWFVSAMMAISPFAAPIVTLEGLLEYDSSSRWKIWYFAAGWCVLASAFAAAMFWAAVGTFDRCLGRVPEPSMWD